MLQKIKTFLVILIYLFLFNKPALNNGIELAYVATLHI